ncbi:pentatricopeptide repeat-containing protein At2g13600-like [Gastrolobium bilobum]|uniref:pentatricopeptide repeat-containing protein At2g13600-like n=1 Tax=Gastrolobium bilobum TaxID=150636 RepID=UPI002AAF69D5|nr:pentatricopeptide repeat-containing protein At2g13600-like [Gastrolobium bilobum]
MHSLLLVEPLTLPPRNPRIGATTNRTKRRSLSLQPSNSTHQYHPHQKVPHLTLYDEPLSSTTYALILESCGSLGLGKQVHAHSIKAGFRGHEFVETKLLQMYGNTGSFECARLLFDTMSLRNLYSWTALLRLHVDMGFFEEAFLLFKELLYEGVRVQLDFFVFPVVLKICCGLDALELGRQLHGMVFKHEFVTNVYVGNALIDMYGKCGSLDEAKKVLEGMPQKDCVSWNSIITACAANGMVYEALDLLENMSAGDLAPNLVSWSAVIAGFSQNGYDVESVELLARMLRVGMKPNARTLASVLPACARIQWQRLGKELHGYIIRHEFFSNAFVVNALVDVYRRCGNMKSAFKIFSKFSRKCTASYNTIITGYWENGNIFKAKELFDQMEQGGVERDRISWNSIISGYVDNFLFDKAFGLFQDLLKEGIEPDSFTLGSVLTGCADMASIRRGKEVHSQVIVKGLQSNSFVGGALVEMYCKCQDIMAAQMAFEEVTERDVATWNALISGYARSNQTQKIEELLQKMEGDGFEPNVHTWNGIIAGYVENKHYDSATQLFTQMQISNLRPDIYTVGIILAACSKLATIQRGKQVHAYSIRAGHDSDVHIGAALVDMYAKCGGIKYCYLVYNRISNPDLVSHNALLTAYAMHGHGEEGIALFRRMLAGKVRPDHVTFLSVLSSCVHAGSIEIGRECFSMMETYNVTPTLKHYTCMVDLLSRAGKLNEAYKLIKNMPMEADSVTWSALLGGCFIHSEVALGEIAAKKLIELEPYNTGNYVMLANLYASVGRWHYVAQTRQLMKDKGIQKSPGCSWIEDRDGVHVFLASDKTHKRADEIYYILDNLTNLIRIKHKSQL